MFYGNSLYYKPTTNLRESYNDFMIEYNNFTNIIESFDILSENNILIEADNKSFWQRIKEIWGKFIKWVTGVIDRIKGLFKKNSVKEAKKNVDDFFEKEEQKKIRIPNQL